MMTKPLSPTDCRALLDAPTGDALETSLRPRGFADPPADWKRLRFLAQSAAAPDEFVAGLVTRLEETAAPGRVLTGLHRLAKSHPEPPALCRTLAENPHAVDILVTVIAGSQFLTEILLRTPAYVEPLIAHQNLAQLKTRADFAARIIEELTAAPDDAPDTQLDALRRFQRWQLLRIGTCDLLGLFDLTAVTGQLSALADSLVQASLEIVARQTGIAPDNFVVLGMGKLGGQELNYSSDIDLLFLADGDSARYEKLGKRLINALTRVTSEGFLYRVDMRLRPWGKVGALVTSLDGHKRYLQQHARLWEKQAMVKARPIAGNLAAGDAFLQDIEPLIFAATPQVVQANVREMKEAIEEQLQRQQRTWGEVKLGEGSIRDIEFITQYLQLAHGDAYPQLHSRNTLNALSRLAAYNFITTPEHRALADGYIFLRSVEHWLQMMHYRQIHTLPTDAAEITSLAHRLGFSGPQAGDTLLEHYRRHTETIRQIYHRHLNSETPAALAAPDRGPVPSTVQVESHLARLAPAYQNAFTADEIARHAALAERITTDNLVEVVVEPMSSDRWRVTIVAYDYLGELSIICGLFFVYGLDILEGNVFTYRPAKAARQKIIDVFVVHSVEGHENDDFWQNYSADLSGLLHQMEAGRQTDAQGALAKRVANTLYRAESTDTTRLYPIDIEIDNAPAAHRTILHINTLDTVGFLYELTNALALTGIYIARVAIGSSGKRVHDVLHVTDGQGQKITNPQKLRELRAATVLTKHFTHLLPRSPNPEAALTNFRQFLQKLFARPNWPDELISLEKPEVLTALARLLGVSDFLWADFLRMQYEHLFPVVSDVDSLTIRHTKDDLRHELDALLNAAATAEARRQALNAFKDRHMFRIDMRHILRYIRKSGQFSAELTDLADVVVETAYAMCRAELVAEFGNPRQAGGQPATMAVCGLGTLGGREMGFASDIELIFIYSENGQTDGPAVVSCAEFYENLVRAVLKTIHSKREGVFEVDLQLRPYGKTSQMAVSLDAFQSYYAPGGPAWAYERQALIKLRPIAGDKALGKRLVALRDEFVYTGAPFDVAAMRGMRERQVRHLVTPGTINAKFSPGGLVDVEYLVQGLQITHGHDMPFLRLTNTRETMAVLADVGLLARIDYTNLLEAHIFLRRLINAMRMVRGHAKDLTVPPPDSEDFYFLARRLHYGDDVARLQADLQTHMQHVREINARLLT